MAKETAPAQSPELYVPSTRPAKQTTFREWVLVNQIGKISTNTKLSSTPAIKALKALRPAQRHPGSSGGKTTFTPLTCGSALQASR